MPVLTFAAIDADPRNAVTHRLPDNAGRELLELALCAAHACAEIENRLMYAARAGLYRPHWWYDGKDCPDGHELNESRFLSALDAIEHIEKRMR